MTNYSVLCIIAEGFEEIEAVTVIDILRRANIQVTTAGLNGSLVSGSHGIKIQCDNKLRDIDTTQFTHLFLPGGQPGTNNLKKDPAVLEIVKDFFRFGKGISAICAAPTVLHAAGVLSGKRVTSYPAEKNVFVDSVYLENNVVEDGSIITSRGVGTAIEFALYLVEKLTDHKNSEDLARRILFR